VGLVPAISAHFVRYLHPLLRLVLALVVHQAGLPLASSLPENLQEAMEPKNDAQTRQGSHELSKALQCEAVLTS